MSFLTACAKLLSPIDQVYFTFRGPPSFVSICLNAWFRGEHFLPSLGKSYTCFNGFGFNARGNTTLFLSTRTPDTPHG